MTRRDRLDTYLDTHSLEAMWFARPNTFAWLTGGNNLVSEAAAVGEAAAGYDGDSVTVVTNNIEAPRLREEELDESVQVDTFQWYESSLAEAVRATSPEPAAADFDVAGFETVDASPLRQPLTDSDIERYRELGSDAAEALETVCRDLDPTDSEQSVAARLDAALRERGCSAPVVLVGGGDRATQYRHLPPTDSELGEYVLVSIVAQRGGLHASCTRTVAFDAPSWLEARHQAATTVETTALAASQRVGREGGTAGDVFAAIQRAYTDVGYEDEWRHHHQGGAAGFDGREWFAEPGLDVPVRLPMAFAWNPTVQGAKSEGTVLITEDAVEPLTTTGDWPTRTVTAGEPELRLNRPAVLER